MFIAEECELFENCKNKQTNKPKVKYPLTHRNSRKEAIMKGSMSKI